MFAARTTYFFVILSFVALFPSSSFAANFKAGGVRLNKEVKPLREIKRENIVAQSLDYSCGPAGLSTLLYYYLGDKVSEKEIISTLLKTVPMEKVKARHGFSLLDLKSFAQSKGYKVTGYKMTEQFLKELKQPVLVPIRFKNYHHFVIVKGVVGDRIFIADPATGNVSMKINKFMDIWTGGIGLVVERKEGDKRAAKYALKVEKKDFIMADYKMTNRLMDVIAYRTQIYPGEF